MASSRRRFSSSFASWCFLRALAPSYSLSNLENSPKNVFSDEPDLLLLFKSVKIRSARSKKHKVILHESSQKAACVPSNGFASSRNSSRIGFHL